VEVVEAAPDLARPRGLAGKLRHWSAFRRGAWNAVAGLGPDALLWVASADTALALGRELRRRRYVLQLHELYDGVWHYRRMLGPIVRHAQAVVVPEPSRAAICRSWYRLVATPHVLPNKPHTHPRQPRQPVTHPSLRTALAEVGEARLVLYQGHIHPERDLRGVARALAALGQGWRLVLLGQNHHGYLAEIVRLCPDLVHVPYVAAPGHLELTSYARVGVAVYGYDCLNSIFCAPNKVWEYAGFGVPSLCQDLPGLVATVAASGAGRCADTGDVPALCEALIDLDRHHDDYSRRATAFYDSMDLEAVVTRIVHAASVNGVSENAGRH
jgi:glycosyltransferase involved in cell wall biosynthesis